MKIKRLGKSLIWAAEFNTQYEVASTMLRPQEMYECPNPRFRDKIFLLEDYMDWYANEYGNFTYYEDWSGFNVPLKVVNELRHSEVYLSKKEKELLTKLEEAGATNDGYLIAYCKNNKRESLETMKHEIAHGLYYLDKDYKNGADGITKKMSSTLKEQYKEKLIDTGYDDAVLKDEMQAYLIEGYQHMMLFKTEDDVTSNKVLHLELEEIFNERLKIHEISL
jgi:hypothetical protein